MKLAIVIPYYRHTFFEATLSSLALQSDQRFKVYIGNDASPDDPSALLQQYEGKFDFEYRKFEDNQGRQSLVKQWERCLALVGSEDWVMILGDDDVLSHNAVAAFYERETMAHNAKVFRFSTQVIDGSGNGMYEVCKYSDGETAVNFLFSKSRSSLSEYVFSAAQIRKIGFKAFPLAWFSDVLAVLEFSEFSIVHAINDARVYIRVTNESISGTPIGAKQKNAAATAFYYYLLKEKHQHFNREQQKTLLLKLGKCYRNDKKQVGVFLKISRLYMSRFFGAGYFGFVRSVMESTVKSIFSR